MLKHTVFLTQTDTTIGFLSQDALKLDSIKQRPTHKHYIKAVNTLERLKDFTRVPKIHKNSIRRSKKTTFIMPNGHSYRVITDRHHLLLLNRLGWAYTTSANLSGKAYDKDFAKKYTDIVVEPLRETKEASSIFKLGKNRRKRIR